MLLHWPETIVERASDWLAMCSGQVFRIEISLPTLSQIEMIVSKRPSSETIVSVDDSPAIYGCMYKGM